MNCYECNGTAVGICAQCNRGLCKAHGDFDGSHFYCHAHNASTKIKELKKMMEAAGK